MEYAWPGNIRELENVIEYLAYVADDIVSPQQLSFYHEENSILPEQTVVDKRFELIYQSYVTRGFIAEIQMILQIFQQAQHALGRNYITAQLNKQTGREMSEQQLRYRLQLLKQAQLIQVGKARQGSLITQQGLDFLQYLQVQQTIE
jgi:transcriptional regulator with AAA-type ATPase domain